MKRDCPCGTPTRDRFLCYGCGHRLEGYLTDLHDLNGELHTALTRMVRMSDRVDGGRSAEKPLVFNQAAAEAIRLIRSTLVAWIREIAEDTGTPLPQRATVTTLTDWLLSQLGEIIAHREDAPMLHDEIRFLRNRAQCVVDLPINRTTFEAGPCPEMVDGGPCDGIVWAVVPRDEDKRPRLECRNGCRAVWYAEQWHRTGERIAGRRQALDPELSVPNGRIGLTSE